MPRANRRRDDARPLAFGALDLERRERHADGVWVVRRVRGRPGAGDYRCPGCQQTFSGTRAHLVVWPARGRWGIDDRRHWHTPCWRTRGPASGPGASG